MRFRNLSIESKIRTVFLPIFILTILIIIGLVSYITKDILVKQATNNVEYELKLIVNNINKLDESINGCANQTILALNDYVGENDVKFDKVDELMNLQRLLNRVNVLYPRAAELSYVRLDGIYYTTKGDISTPIVGDIQKTKLFDDIQSSNNKGWLLIDSLSSIYHLSDINRLAYAKEVVNIKNFTPMGYVLINVNENEFLELYNQENSTYNTDYLIVEDKRIINSNLDSKIGTYINTDFENNQIINYENERNFVSIRNIDGTNWQLIGLTNYSDILKPVYELTVFLSVIGVVVMILVLIITLALAKKISEPIQQMTNHINNLKDGKLKKYEYYNNGIEIDTFIMSFNDMIDRNELLIQRINATERKKRKFELALLQSQIKPHFLYNTLDIIVRLAALDRKQEVIEATKNIAEFYRITLSKGNEYINISEELELVQRYLYIQKIRYPNVFEYDVEIRCKHNILEDYLIPKFTLQPIIENAIYHGLKLKKTRGNIRLTITENQEYIYIEIDDNGVGISPERMKKLLNDSSDNSYALSNVNKRLILYFGNDCGIEITSKLNEGTRVKCTLKKKSNKTLIQI